MILSKQDQTEDNTKCMFNCFYVCHQTEWMDDWMWRSELEKKLFCSFSHHTHIYVAFYLFDSIYSDTDGINAFYAYSYKYRKDWSELKQQYKREKTPSVCPTYIHISYNCCCCFISLYFLCLFKPHRHTTLKPETNMPFRIGRVFVYLFRCTGYKKNDDDGGDSGVIEMETISTRVCVSV